MSTSPASSRDGWRTSTKTCASSSRRSSRRCRTCAAAVLPAPCTSATGSTVPSVSCSNALPPPNRSCSSSMTSWADAAAVDLAASLLHRPAAAAVLIVLASRPNHPSPRLRKATEHALHAGQLTRIALDPLTGEEAAAMLGREPSDATAAVLYEESGGNPFYLEQLARAANGAARIVPGSDVSVSELKVPAMVVTALSDELELLSARSRRVLEGASVAGDPFEPELAAAASDIGEPAAMEAIDELVRADLIRPTSVPRRFRFRHPIVRRAVYEASPVAWRIGAHGRVAGALAGRGAGELARAPHLDASAKVGDAAAASVLAEAGRQSAQLAPSTAARWFSG